MGGIFITEGMRVSIENLSFSFDDSGAINSSLSINVAYDASIMWARIVLAQRQEAVTFMNARKAVWGSPEIEGSLRGKALQDEFQMSMQAIVSSAICMDAFYDHIARYAPISPEVRKSWKEKKVARYAQVSETLRAAFNIRPKALKPIREFMEALYKLRDAAVHPSNKPHPPHQHPDLSISTDWRMVAFRGDVADLLGCYCMRILWDTAHKPNFKSKDLEKFMMSFRNQLTKILPEGVPTPVALSVSFPRGPKG